MALNPKKAVGLDIGSSVVKAVQLRKAGRGYELERFGIAEIYPGVDKKSPGINRREAKVQAIRQAMQNGGISARQAVSAVSGETIIIRYIQLPEMPENELKGAIRWEAEDYIPFPLEEVYLDSMILGRSNDAAGAPKIDVLLVAAKKDLVAEHMDILRAADLQPAVVDVDSFAFLNAFEANYLPSATDVVALLNIGAEITNINIYIGGVSRFSRDIAVAGDSITHEIQQRLNSTFGRAEELKIKEGAPIPTAEEADAEAAGGSSLLDTIRGTVEKITGEDLAEDSPEYVAGTVMRNSLGNLTSEIRRSIQFFENQPNGRAVQRVAIGGGSATLRNLDSYLGRQLGLPVEVIDPLRNIAFTGAAAERAKLEKARPMLGVGIGLALRIFD